jgi:hypothetical protein
MLSVAINCGHVRQLIRERSEVEGKYVFREVVGEYVWVKGDDLEPRFRRRCAHGVIPG